VRAQAVWAARVRAALLSNLRAMSRRLIEIAAAIRSVLEKLPACQPTTGFSHGSTRGLLIANPT
jgi:hypothetical protein